MSKLSQEKQAKKEDKKLFAPSLEEQTVLKLQGKCPHSEGYAFVNRYGEDTKYQCKMCGYPLWI